MIGRRRLMGMISRKVLPAALAAAVSLGSVQAQAGAGYTDQNADLLITADPKGTAGFLLVNWARDGLFTGIRGSLIRTEGERVLWSAHHAETQMLSTYLGYGREQYIGFSGGFAFREIIGGAVFTFGIGIVRERRFKKFRDDDMGPGHEVYHIRDGMKQRWLFDLLLGAYHRGRQVNLGLGFSMATRSLNILFGFPLSLDTLRHGSE